MSKLSFRARALDATKPMPILMAEELPDLPDYSAINRAVPQMPSGMEKEEECEHHLQRAICAGLIIPTPEVAEMPHKEYYDEIYPADYKQPRQLIHMQPFAMEQDIPDYDMDSEDERWLKSQTSKLDLGPLKFEEMMDKLEKSSGQTVVTLNEAKALLKDDEDLVIAVFDYWLNKRLTTQHPLILTVKTEQRTGTTLNNPYLAFRRRGEKMQTRKIRKNDETSYEKMLKLRRDLQRAVTLLEIVKKRERMKREFVNTTAEIFNKRFHARDFSGTLYAHELTTTLKAHQHHRPVFTPIFHNHYTSHQQPTTQQHQNWPITASSIGKSSSHHLIEGIANSSGPNTHRKEKRQYKKRKHKSGRAQAGISSTGGYVLDGGSHSLSSDEDFVSHNTGIPHATIEDNRVQEDEGQFAFRRNKFCNYHKPRSSLGNWPWCSPSDNGYVDKKYRFSLTSLSSPKRCIGFARRRLGRGGRVILDRIGCDNLAVDDNFWRTLDFSIIEPTRTAKSEIKCESEDNKRTDLLTTYSVKNSDISLNTSEVQVKMDVDSIIKEESIERLSEDPVLSLEKDNEIAKKEMVEFLRALRRDGGLHHFRPKTPPSDYEPPCSMLPYEDDNSSLFGANGSGQFSMEVQMATDSNNPSNGVLLDSAVDSIFVSEPFHMLLPEECEEHLSHHPEDDVEVPITDTRQHQAPPPPTSLPAHSPTYFVNTVTNSESSALCAQQHNYAATASTVVSPPSTNNNSNTLSWPSSSTNNHSNIGDVYCLSSSCDSDPLIEEDDLKMTGCSRFKVTDLAPAPATGTTKWHYENAKAFRRQTRQNKINNVNPLATSHKNNTFSTNSSSNSSATSSVISGSRVAGQIHQHNRLNDSCSANGLLPQIMLDVRPAGTKVSSYGYSSSSSNSAGGATGIHPPLTINNINSANSILEIPITNLDPMSNMGNRDKHVVVDDRNTGAGGVGGPTTPTNNNNKAKTIVRKNNLVMEVT